MGPKCNCPITWEAKGGLTKAVDITMETRCPMAAGLKMKEEARSHDGRGKKLGLVFQTVPPCQFSERHSSLHNCKGARVRCLMPHSQGNLLGMEYSSLEGSAPEWPCFLGRGVRPRQTTPGSCCPKAVPNCITNSPLPSILSELGQTPASAHPQI